MKNDLKWRLKELPTAEGVAALVDKKVLTPEEARDILLTEGKQDAASIKELQEQIDFLKELVRTLSLSGRGATAVYYPQYIESRPWWRDMYFGSTSTGGMRFLASSNNAFSVN